jgi:small subunit ribosomal protein S21
MADNITIKVQGNNLEGAIKKLRRAVKKSGLQREMARHECYGKPSERRRQREAQAHRRRLKAEQTGTGY